MQETMDAPNFLLSRSTQLHQPELNADDIVKQSATTSESVSGTSSQLADSEYELSQELLISTEEGLVASNNCDDKEDDGASDYFKKLFQRQRSRGIMIVSTHRESVSAASYAGLLQASRERRADQLKARNMPANQVTFQSVTIHEFPIIFGDNPGCPTGPPLTIAWKPLSSTTISFDEYEETRAPRRAHTQMIMPSWMRIEILQRAGYARGQIVHLTRPVNIIRQCRKRSKEGQNLDKLHEFIERFYRCARHVVTLGQKKRQEKIFLEPYLYGQSFGKRCELSNSITSTVAIEFLEDI